MPSDCWHVPCCSLARSGNATKNTLLTGNCLYWSGTGCRESCMRSLFPSPNVSHCMWQRENIMFPQEHEISGSSAQSWYKRFLSSLGVFPASVSLSWEGRSASSVPDYVQESPRSIQFRILFCKCQPLTRRAPGSLSMLENERLHVTQCLLLP